MLSFFNLIYSSLLTVVSFQDIPDNSKHKRDDSAKPGELKYIISCMFAREVYFTLRLPFYKLKKIIFNYHLKILSNYLLKYSPKYLYNNAI